ncbi:MAG: penicillin-binding transpeptidase domain-containing protein [Actinomycetota bacterium]
MDPTHPTSEDAVYADWTKIRLLAPAAVGAVVAALAVVAAAVVLGGGGDEAATTAPVTTLGSGEAVVAADLEPEERAALVLDDFVEALETSNLATQAYAFTDPATASTEYARLVAELGAFTIDVTPGAVRLVDAANASAAISVAWTLDDGTVFTTEGEADLVLLGTSWLVDWEPAILEFSLDPGDVLVRQRVVAPRAPILGRDGVPLVDNRDTVEVAVIPREAGEIAPLSEALGPLVWREPADIRDLIAPSPSDARVVVATLRAEDIPPVESQLRALPGVVLQPSTFPLAPSNRFARALLGRSAAVTAEIIDEHPELFQAGDIAGRSGLQREYNARLAGQPGFEIRVRRRFPTSSTPAAATTTPTTAETTTASSDPASDPGRDTGAVAEPSTPDDPDVIYRDGPFPGTPLQLTLDARIQRAAEEALTRTDRTSALVAVQPSTGHILAIANGPGDAVNNFAITGQYPPGSVFKIVTAYAALERGFGPRDPVDCPQFLEVDGRQFTNAEGEVLGTVPLRRAFFLSCNTAFINLASFLDPSDFTSTAARMGIGSGYELGTASYAGSVPTPGSAVEKAATSFGQGRILVSPLSAAVLAATAASGTYRPPSLVIEPDHTPPTGQALDPAAVANLQDFMRAVVTNGTGNAVNGAAGGPVSGKTGTAEFGDAVPPEAHAWFVGYQNDLAFAVFVEGGEFGGATAAPIAGDFLNRLAN